MVHLHIVIWLLRFSGSFLDGRVGRGTMPWNLSIDNALKLALRALRSFHFWNWLRRDIPIIILYWDIYGAPWVDPLTWAGWTALHYIAHVLAYGVGEKFKNEK